ncbi:MAG: TonB-dependent receptor, partial [uncultured Gemmatimonadaceae bacterium]
ACFIRAVPLRPRRLGVDAGRRRPARPSALARRGRRARLHRPRAGRAADRPRGRARDRRGERRGDHRRRGAGGGHHARRPVGRRRPLHHPQRPRRQRHRAGAPHRLLPEGDLRGAGRRRAGRRAGDLAAAGDRAARGRDGLRVGRARHGERGARPPAHRHRRRQLDHLAADRAEPRRRRRAGRAARERRDGAGRPLRLRARPRRALHHGVHQRRAAPEPRARAQGGAARPVPRRPAAEHHDEQDVHPRPVGRLQRRAGEHRDARVPRPPRRDVLHVTRDERRRHRPQRARRAHPRPRVAGLRRQRPRPPRHRRGAGRLPRPDVHADAVQRAGPLAAQRVDARDEQRPPQLVVRRHRRRRGARVRPARRLRGLADLRLQPGGAPERAHVARARRQHRGEHRGDQSV